jgi:uncharacterized membrane protein
LDELLITLTEFAVPIIDLVALITIVAGTIECVVRVATAALSGGSRHDLRDVWLRYAGWLVAALTFQLGADILETAIAPSWDDIGRLAAIAVIRTFLDFFLARDVSEIRERQGRPRHAEPERHEA